MDPTNSVSSVGEFSQTGEKMTEIQNPISNDHNDGDEENINELSFISDLRSSEYSVTGGGKGQYLPVPLYGPSRLPGTGRMSDLDGSEEGMQMGDGESTEEDAVDFFFGLERRKTSLMWNRIVSIAIVLTLIVSVTVIIVLYFETKTLQNSSSGDDDNPPNEYCYMEPSCPAIIPSPAYDLQGFTNVTGWDSITSTTPTCCNICPKSNLEINYPSAAREHQQQTSWISRQLALSEYDSEYILRELDGPSIRATANRYDYLVMDEIWLPQFCYALESGHDPTLSHTSGSKCLPRFYDSTARLTIHGLWPNRYNGSALCCADPGATSVPTLDITALQSNTQLFYELNEVWFDPTLNSTSTYPASPSNPAETVSCSSCYLLNHEWQKHGSCFAPTPSSLPLEDSTSSSSSFGLRSNPMDINGVRSLTVGVDEQRAYFEAGLFLFARLNSTNNAIADLTNSVVSRASIEALYAPYQVNIMCDPQDTSINTNENTGVLLEIQTCWDGPLGDGDFTMINCQAIVNSRYSRQCPDNVFVRDFTI
jgi:ribonuclease I